MCGSDATGKISIDRVVTLRSSVLPVYVLIKHDGSVITADEVVDGAFDFLTTIQHKDGSLSFRSYNGHFLSAQGGQVGTRPYAGPDERFKVVMKDYQYAFRSRAGGFLSISDREPFVVLNDGLGDTELFQLFSLTMQGLNVGKQIETLEKHGMVMIPDLVDEETLKKACESVRPDDKRAPKVGHETRERDLFSEHPDPAGPLAALAAHPILLQVVRRCLSPEAKLSSSLSVRTDADFVRRKLEETTWDVVHPYNSLVWVAEGSAAGGGTPQRLTLTVMWLLDDFTEANSTWSNAPPAARAPHLSSPEERAQVVRSAQPIEGKRGSAWLYLGPRWISNTVGAGSFWRDYDAQTRYKYLAGEIQDASFRALAESVQSAPEQQELCPQLVEFVYTREYVKSLERPSLRLDADPDPEKKVQVRSVDEQTKVQQEQERQAAEFRTLFD